MQPADPLVLAPTPRAWLAEHLPRRFQHGEPVASDAPGWLTVAELLADDAALLRAAFQQLRDEGYPGSCAATFVASYTAGSIADAVAFAALGTNAGIELDPATLRWHRHAEGYVDRVELGAPTFLVAPTHPWAGQPDAEVVDDAGARRTRTLRSLVDAVQPLVDAAHGLARVGKAGLWNEVVDGIGFGLSWQDVIPARADTYAALDALLREPSMPWKARPWIELRRVGEQEVVVGQKGGCCLAYTRQDDPAAVDSADDAHDGDAHDGDVHDEDERAYRERFPEVDGEPSYCLSCSLRDHGDSIDRQMFFVEREHQRTATATAVGTVADATADGLDSDLVPW